MGSAITKIETLTTGLLLDLLLIIPPRGSEGGV